MGDDGSGHVQHAFKIQPNDVPRLRSGQGFIVSHRYASKIYVPQIDPVLETLSPVSAEILNALLDTIVCPKTDSHMSE